MCKSLSGIEIVYTTVLPEFPFQNKHDLHIDLNLNFDLVEMEANFPRHEI